MGDVVGVFVYLKSPRPTKGGNEIGMNNLLLSLTLLLLELPEVEVELLTLKDVAVAAAALARPGGDARVETASGELVDKRLSEGDALLPPLGQLPPGVVGHDSGGSRLGGGSSGGSGSLTLLLGGSLLLGVLLGRLLLSLLGGLLLGLEG